MHHDPLLSSRAKAVTNWGHSWVVLGVIVELPFRGPLLLPADPVSLVLEQGKRRSIAERIASVRNWPSRC